MRKILNEWKTFLVEDKEKDDIKVANTFVNALSSGTNKETQEEYLSLVEKLDPKRIIVYKKLEMNFPLE